MAANTDSDGDSGTISLTRKLRRSGNSTVLSLPPEILESADLESGEEIEFAVDDNGRVVLNKSDE